jgi:hypothetical protein
MAPRTKNHVRLTGSGAVSAVPGRVTRVVFTPAAAEATLKLYDAADGNGTAILDYKVDEHGASLIDNYQDGILECHTAIYAVLAGTGAIANIWWE